MDNPSENIVIAVTSYFKPTIVDRIDFIQRYIEPFIFNFIILILVTKEKTDDNMINPPDSGEGFP